MLWTVYVEKLGPTDGRLFVWGEGREKPLAGEVYLCGGVVIKQFQVELDVNHQRPNLDRDVLVWARNFVNATSRSDNGLQRKIRSAPTGGGVTMNQPSFEPPPSQEDYLDSAALGHALAGDR